jgi:hypothetical protein
MGRLFRGTAVGTNPRTGNDNLVFTSTGTRSQLARFEDNYRSWHVSLRKYTAMPQACITVLLDAVNDKMESDRECMYICMCAWYKAGTEGQQGEAMSTDSWLSEPLGQPLGLGTRLPVGFARETPAHSRNAFETTASWHICSRKHTAMPQARNSFWLHAINKKWDMLVGVCVPLYIC